MEELESATRSQGRAAIAQSNVEAAKFRKGYQAYRDIQFQLLVLPRLFSQAELVAVGRLVRNLPIERREWIGEGDYQIGLCETGALLFALGLRANAGRAITFLRKKWRPLSECHFLRR